MSVSIVWLCVGAALLALEAFAVPGVGLLFAGLGAIITAVAVESAFISDLDHIMQGAVFLITTSIFSALLWKKLKAWRLNPNAPQYSNIVGTEAAVVGTLRPGKKGEVKWSGAVMHARLAEGAVAELAEGAIVTVVAVEGNVLSVVSKA
jgi:membrane protein implicated in regulation of membrane protease activity